MSDFDYVNPSSTGISKVAEDLEKKQKLRENINSLIEERSQEAGKTVDQYLNDLPKQRADEHGRLALVRMDGVGLTENGKLTKTKFFERLRRGREVYKDLVFTKDEAIHISTHYETLSIGINSVVPLKCFGQDCSFADTCPYQQVNKAPVGLPCLLEYDLLLYHTEQLMDHFNVEPDDYVDLMLVQELAELVVYEMRVTRILSERDNNRLNGLKMAFSPNGTPYEEEVIHWAWDLKEKIKTRRLKVLETLMGIKSKKKSKNDNVDTSVSGMLSIMDKLNTIMSAQNTKIISDEDV